MQCRCAFTYARPRLHPFAGVVATAYNNLLQPLLPKGKSQSSICINEQNKHNLRTRTKE